MGKFNQNWRKSNGNQGNDFIIVDEDETPIFAKEDISLLGFSDFTINKEEKTIINLKTNVVSLPYDPNFSIYKNPNNLMKANLVGIKIAKKNVKPGSGCSSCVGHYWHLLPYLKKANLPELVEYRYLISCFLETNKI